MLRNRLHSVIHRHNLVPPKGRLFAQKHRQWWTEQDLPQLEKLQVAQNLTTLDHLTSQIEAVDKELARLSNTEPWASQTPFVMQIPGFGLIVTMTVLAAIGDISRFCADKKLVGYSGLHPSVHQSGEIHRYGRITKEGRKDLRWAAVEAAWAAVRSNAYWKSEFKRLKKRMHANQAIVAIARRLLVALWHVLTKKEPYRLSSQEQTVRKMLRWSWCMDDQALDGLTRQQFIRYALMRLDVDYEGSTIEYGGYPRRIASAKEVLAICPDLSPPD
jgi:transposase